MEAIEEKRSTRCSEAIKMYKIKGVATTLPFGTFVFEHEAFVSGNFDTHFVKDYYTPEALENKGKSWCENSCTSSAYALSKPAETTQRNGCNFS